MILISQKKKILKRIILEETDAIEKIHTS